MRRIAKLVILVVVVAVIGTLVWHFLKTGGRSTGSELRVYGNIEIRQAELAFDEQERIVQLLVEEGDRVAEGQVLARLRTDRLEAQIRQTQAQIDAQQELVNRLEAGTRRQEIEQARAEVAAAQAKLHNSRITFQRNESLAGAGASSRQALDDARAQMDVDLAQLEVKQKALNLALEGPRKEDIAAARHTLEALEASMSLLRVRMADMTLRSPSSGVIQNRILEPGEMAGPNRPVVMLALNDPKWVRGYVPEPALGIVALGMRAAILSDSFPDRTFEGWIGFISPVAEFTPKSVETEDLRTKLVYEIRVFVRDPQDMLRLGAPVTVIVEKGSSSPAGSDGAPAPRHPSAAAQKG